MKTRPVRYSKHLAGMPNTEIVIHRTKKWRARVRHNLPLVRVLKVMVLDYIMDNTIFRWFRQAIDAVHNCHIRSVHVMQWGRVSYVLGEHEWRIDLFLNGNDVTIYLESPIMPVCSDVKYGTTSDAFFDFINGESPRSVVYPMIMHAPETYAEKLTVMYRNILHSHIRRMCVIHECAHKCKLRLDRLAEAELAAVGQRKRSRSHD